MTENHNEQFEAILGALSEQSAAPLRQKMKQIDPTVPLSSLYIAESCPVCGESIAQDAQEKMVAGMKLLCCPKCIPKNE